MGDARRSREFDRRDVLRAAAVLGIATPVLWRQTKATAATSPIGPQWIAFGPSPSTQMYLTWSLGSASAALVTPKAPQVRWGPTTAYGNVQAAGSSETVPLPAGATGDPSENTVYSSVLLDSLAPGTTYHYSVSNDGVAWGPDATFTTAVAGISNFRFTAFGDEAISTSTAGQMVNLAAAQHPAFHLVAGDLAYSTPEPLKYLDFAGFKPSQWDKYLAVVGPRGAQSIPWMASVGAHEVEPLGNNGYAGFVTRFPQPYDATSGSPVVHTFTYGNVAVIHLDGNDLSAQETVKTGYTQGAQTAWLAAQLAGYRAVGSGIDFVVVVCNCSCYSSNRNHGSDGGLRDVWGPLFDTYQVDLVISGHVHAYERTNPMRAGQPTRAVAAGGTVNPPVDGTTYICAGGGGNGLYKTWYGTTGSGDAGNTTAPKVWRWSGGDTATGGTGKSQDIKDTAKNFSAVRRGVYSCVVVDVTAPTVPGGETTLAIRTLMPAQSGSSITSIANPTVIDSITVVRTSTVDPAPPDGKAHGKPARDRLVLGRPAQNRPTLPPYLRPSAAGR
ncbi:MAG TPA: metallophosphoesterase family protein [Mycobacteriales bacterium]|jgi:hypothetical protein|nr:metallophosphoesterase family protein [Mycobacteriales bacterium]